MAKLTPGIEFTGSIGNFFRVEMRMKKSGILYFKPE
jgi:hypothetical protein